MARYKHVETGEVVDAVLLTEDGLPDGAELREFDHPDGYTESRVFLATKDDRDDEGESAPGKTVDVSLGNWLVTHDDGTVAIAHPSVFESEFEEDK